MKPPPFQYRAPRSVDEAVALLGEHGDEAKVLAGGQSLIPLLSLRLARPSVLVDVNEVADLAGIRALDGGVAIGATTRERDAERSPLVAETAPVAAEALPLIGHVPIRNRGTVGGSLAHADASAELPAVALITGATMTVRSVRGERVVPAAEFFVGHFQTSMADEELLTELRIPAGPADAGWAFSEIARRHGDFALVGAAAMVALQDELVREARLVLIGVAGTAVDAASSVGELVGHVPEAGAVDAVAREAVRGLEPASDVHGSAEFRRHVAGVVARRALTLALDRAGAAS